MAMMEDLDKETVDFKANYDERLMEPCVLPGKLPNLTLYQYEAVPVGDARFWLIGRADGTRSEERPTFGLVDEASKLNLNTATDDGHSGDNGCTNGGGVVGNSTSGGDDCKDTLVFKNGFIMAISRLADGRETG